MQTQRQAAANRQTMPTEMGCESIRKGRYHLHPHLLLLLILPAFVIRDHWHSAIFMRRLIIDWHELMAAH